MGGEVEELTGQLLRLATVSQIADCNAPDTRREWIFGVSGCSTCLSSRCAFMVTLKAEHFEEALLLG